MSQLKIALVHDFLREYGGAERVLEALHQLFPEAPVYTAFIDSRALGKFWTRFADWDWRLTWFSRLPGHRRFFSPLRFLAPRAFADLDLSEFDLVISSANAFMAKAVQVPHGYHLCYCHTPPRSLYGYSTMAAWQKNWLIAAGGGLINHYLRVVDWQVAQQVDGFIANSAETARRIKKFYRRDAKIIFPPVKISSLPTENGRRQAQTGQSSTSGYYFYISRLGLQKHPEIAIEACNQLHLPLKVAGTGPMLPQLQQIAGPTIEFLGPVDDGQLAQLYAGATALLYPVEDEDFGLVPIESLLAGTPVIAHASGGPRETIQAGQNGVLFDELSTAGLIKALQKFVTLKFNRPQISDQAQQYSVARFNQQILAVIKDLQTQNWPRF